MRLATAALWASILTVATLGLAGCKGGAVAHDAGEKASGKGLVSGCSQRGISGSAWWKTLVEGGQPEVSQIGACLELLDANGGTVRQNAYVQTSSRRAWTSSS